MVVSQHLYGTNSSAPNKQGEINVYYNQRNIRWMWEMSVAAKSALVVQCCWIIVYSLNSYIEAFLKTTYCVRLVLKN